MADREKVVKALKECIFLHEHPDDDAGCLECPYRPDEKGTCPTMIPFLKDVLELLKEQEARVLTIDELFYMEHQGVYIERRNSQLYATEPAIVLRTSVCDPSLGGAKYILMRENKLSESRWACDYNKDRRNGWRCWTSKPTEEQRKDVKWE